MQKIRLTACFILAATLLRAQQYDIRNFGAEGNNSFLNTTAIQSAIDRCTAEGGGKVMVPAGIFITGTIELKNNVTLYLSEGAVLKATTDTTKLHYLGHMARSMFTSGDTTVVHKQRGLLLAYQQHDIAIAGPGRIYGQGDNEVYKSKDVFNGKNGRPFTFSLEHCTRVKLKDFELLNGAFWNMRLKECTDVVVDGVTLNSRVVANNDGLDLVDCHDVRVANCFFDCGDDGICLKSESPRMVKNVVIANCTIKSESNAIKFGTASIGGFENIAISNCAIRDTRFSGIAIQMVDGGIVDRVTVSNVVMHRVNGSIAIKLGQRSRNHIGAIRNITLSDIYCDGIGLWRPDTTAAYFKPLRDLPIGVTIAGQPGYEIENINLNNLTFEFCGGGTKADAERVMPDALKEYPEYSNFGRTPAYGINIHYAKNITVSNITLRTIDADARPAFYLDAVTTANLNNLQSGITDHAKSFIRVRNCSSLLIQGCKPVNSTVPFIYADGENRDVTIMNNDLQAVQQPLAKPAQGTGIVLFNNYRSAGLGQSRKTTEAPVLTTKGLSLVWQDKFDSVDAGGRYVYHDPNDLFAPNRGRRSLTVQSERRSFVYDSAVGHRVEQVNQLTNGLRNECYATGWWPGNYTELGLAVDIFIPDTVHLAATNARASGNTDGKTSFGFQPGIYELDNPGAGGISSSSNVSQVCYPHQQKGAACFMNWRWKKSTGDIEFLWYHYSVRKNGVLRTDTPKEGQYGYVEEGFVLPKGRWFTLTNYIKMDTDGSNGILESWITDGNTTRMVSHIDGLDLGGAVIDRGIAKGTGSLVGKGGGWKVHCTYAAEMVGGIIYKFITGARPFYKAHNYRVYGK